MVNLKESWGTVGLSFLGPTLPCCECAWGVEDGRVGGDVFGGSEVASVDHYISCECILASDRTPSPPDWPPRTTGVGNPRFLYQ
jgi:hypothetical protein